MKIGEWQLSQQNSADKTTQLKNKLDELLDSVALGDAKKFINNNTKKILELTPSQMKTMHPEDLFEAAYLLRQYAVKLNLDFNRYSVIVDWCSAEIDGQVIEADLADIYQYELKVATVVKQNSYAKQVNTIRKYNSAYREQLRNISKDVTNMANTLENYARWRKYNG